ncbi:MAG: hypothetical protein K2N35_06020 [Muribaculaceae bacterium]|nr:hypothetical protein [Muribaculaceae bacterium]
MYTFDKIIESLKFICRYYEGYGRSGLNVAFEIELSSDYSENNPLEIPFLKVNLNKDDTNDVTEYGLTIDFPYDGENDSDILRKCEDIKTDKFGVDFKLVTYNGYELKASLGNDLQIAATIIQYYILKFAKNQKYELKVNYSFSIYQQGNISSLIRQQNITSFKAVKNFLFDSLKSEQSSESLYFEILKAKDFSNARDLIGNILIVKEDEHNKYFAYIRMEEALEYNLEDSLIRFAEYENKDCLNYIGLNCNKWEAHINFASDQIEDLTYLISEFFIMVYPHMTDDKIIVRIPYYNQTPVNQSTVNLNLCFYHDGRGPSENDLKIVSQLGCFY